MTRWIGPIAVGLLALPMAARAQQHIGMTFEGGAASVVSGLLDDFVDQYNSTNKADQREAFGKLGRTGGHGGAVRFYLFGDGNGVGSTAIGYNRYHDALTTTFVDNGGRELDLKIGDFVAELELGQMNGIRGAFGTVIRDATLRSTRTFSNGSTDGGDGGTGSLSGEFQGSTFQLYGGLSLNLIRFSGALMGGLRLAGAYPFYSSAISGDQLSGYDSKGILDTYFPKSYDRFRTDGFASQDNALPSKIGGYSVSLSLVLGFSDRDE